MSMTADRLLAQYRASGRAFTAAGVRSFVLDAGAPDAEPVVCVHGVPASAYLYRKVVPALAIRALRGVAVDLPGLGLAERSGDADYSWSGLSRWLLSAIDALRLDCFHPVVHDIGGPVGFEVAAAEPGRVLNRDQQATHRLAGRSSALSSPPPIGTGAHRAPFGSAM
jgi:haloalkane dehalogenase